MLSGSSLQESEDGRRFRACPWRRGGDGLSRLPTRHSPHQGRAASLQLPVHSLEGSGRAPAYLGSGTRALGQGEAPAGRLGPERQAVPDLDVLLQDQAAAEGALPLCAIPGGESRVAPWANSALSLEAGGWEVLGVTGSGGAGITCRDTHA